MRKKIVPAAPLEARFKSTANDYLAAGMPVPRPSRDPSVVAGFVAGVILTAAAFFAVAPYIVHR